MSDSDTEPALTKLLQTALCPTPTQTLLLRACLCGDLEAWEEWSEIVGDPKQELGNDTIGIKRLVPLLYVSLRDSGAKLDAEFLSYLRAAYVREELRARTFKRVSGEALGALEKAKVPFIVLEGVSLAESAYPSWALRHCHDVDLWVPQSELQSAIFVLPEFRFYSAEGTNTTLVHPTNLSVAFHTQLFEHYGNPTDLYKSAIETQITGVNVRVLAPHHKLLHICVHAAAGPNRRMLLWVADALHLLRKTPQLDWGELVKAAQQMALPTYVMLRYLREEMSADIPFSVLEELARLANRNRFSALKGATTTTGIRGLISEAKSGSEKILVWGWAISEIPNLLNRIITKRDNRDSPPSEESLP